MQIKFSLNYFTAPHEELKAVIKTKEPISLTLKSDGCGNCSASAKIPAFTEEPVYYYAIPLPTEKEEVTILRAVHKYKDSREQFEQRTHKRLIDIIRPTPKTVEALTNLEIPASVEIEIKR